MIYRILVGDIALQRGDANLAARAYFEAAREAQDPRLARRATEIALFARQRSLALEAAKLWLALDPSAERAKQMVATLTQAGAGGELKTDLERVLAEAAANGNALGDAFLQLNHALSSQSDKGAVFRLIVELAKPYPDVAEAHFAVALAGYNTGLADPDIVAVSIHAADRALELKPGWERAALVKADILTKSSPDAAIKFLNSFLEGVPESRAASVAIAQLYVEQKRYAEARAIFQRLWAEDQSDRELEFAIAALSVQMRDYATAQKLFEELKGADFGEAGAVNFYLAQIAEETKRYDDAIALYREITEGDRAWAAKLRIAMVMGKKGDPAAAIRYLASLEPEGKDQRIERAQTQAQVLRDGGDYQGAYAVLNTALSGEPDSRELLYDVAMAAEKLDKLDEVETRLKRLIELKPDDPQALNALGYTLVDRTQRTAEGLKLIERALALAPADPFILDSMGWAQYRMGNYDDSEKYLRRALADRADPEIAAHLGEVLWAKGQPDRAKEVWQSQLKETPDNPVLLETVRRHSP
ncbi:MAG TPA: tetratricopeptide repeat protein [Casimicrobiaceae bacterium]|nr:tetratricopeptide repeat protein [Casimicrobiaceae bacterium]